MILTEVEGHADEDNQAEPSIEIGDEVNDGDDDVGNSWDDAEHDVAVDKYKHFSQFPISVVSSIDSAASHLSKLLMEEVPRSMLRSTSPVLRPRCQRRERACRWPNSRTWTTRLVYCCTRIHRKERMLLTNPEAPDEGADVNKKD